MNWVGVSGLATFRAAPSEATDFKCTYNYELHIIWPAPVSGLLTRARPFSAELFYRLFGSRAVLTRYRHGSGPAAVWPNLKTRMSTGSEGVDWSEVNLVHTGWALNQSTSVKHFMYTFYHDSRIFAGMSGSRPNSACFLFNWCFGSLKHLK